MAGALAEKHLLAREREAAVTDIMVGKIVLKQVECLKQVLACCMQVKAAIILSILQGYTVQGC